MIHKYQIASTLGHLFGLRSYLEMATHTTGNEYKHVDTKQFSDCTRLMYYCPENWSDNMPITYRTAEGSSRAPGSMIGDKKFDLVLVDTWHEYDNAVEDIDLALSLIVPGGLVLVHDCSPFDAYQALPEHPGPAPRGTCTQLWSGVTYAAYLDKVLNDPTLDYITFDTDYGCGLISKDHTFSGERPSEELKTLWRNRTSENQYELFNKHRAELLRLRWLPYVQSIENIVK